MTEGEVWGKKERERQLVYMQGEEEAGNKRRSEEELNEEDLERDQVEYVKLKENWEIISKASDYHITLFAYETAQNLATTKICRKQDIVSFEIHILSKQMYFHMLFIIYQIISIQRT